MPATSLDRFRHIVFAPEPSGSADACRAVDFGVHQPAEPRPTSQAPASPDEDDRLLAWILRQAGLLAADYCSATLRRRLPSVLRALGVCAIAQARHALQNNPALLDAAMDALLIGVSGFFRDADVFESLAHRLAQHQPHRSLRVCSIGCAAGQELYSLAIVLDQLGRLEGSALLGVDGRPGAIRAAEAAHYSAHALEGVPPDLLEQYFVAGHDHWTLCQRIRRAAVWQVAGAISPLPAGRWDVLLCRNLAMYLTRDAAAGLWRRLEAALAPGGLLVVGSAEQPLGAEFLHPVGPCIYQSAGSVWAAAGS